MTYDDYESEVYQDDVDVLVYYHLRALQQPTTPANLTLLQVLEAVESEMEAQWQTRVGGSGRVIREIGVGEAMHERCTGRGSRAREPAPRTFKSQWEPKR